MTVAVARSDARTIALAYLELAKPRIVLMPGLGALCAGEDARAADVARDITRQTLAVKTTIATREEEAFGIAAGLYLGGAKPTVMLQSSGLGNSLNALTSLLLPYQIPVLILISMRGDAGEWNDAQVPMGRAVRPICDAIGLPHATVDTPESTADTVRLVGQTAFGTRLPGVCLLPRRLTACPPEPRRRRVPK